MSTKTNFSKKKEHTPVVGDVRIRTHGLHIHEYTLHIHEYTETSPALFPERTARKVWLRAIAGASSGAHIHTSVVVYTRLNPTTFRTKGTLKKQSRRSGASRVVTHPVVSTRVVKPTRARLSDRFRRSWRRWLRKRLTSMSTGACRASHARAIAIEIARLHPSIDSRHRRSRSTDRWS